MKFKTKYILIVLGWLLSILLVITVCLLIFQLMSLFCDTKKLCSLIANPNVLKYLLIACFSLLTLYVACEQLHKHTCISRIKALIELRRLLTSDQNRKVHILLSPKDEQGFVSEWMPSNEKEKPTPEGEKDKEARKEIDIENIRIIDVFNYLGTIELGVVMVEQELIDKDTFYSQFGYRIENIFEEKSPIHVETRKHINDNESYYEILKRGKKLIQNKNWK